MVGIERFTPEFERAHFGEAHGQTDVQFHLARFLAITKRSDQWSVAMDFVFVQRHDVAVRVASGGRTVKRECDWTVGERCEFPALQIERGPLFSPARQHADGSDLPISDARACLNADIIGSRAAAADAQAAAL